MALLAPTARLVTEPNARVRSWSARRIGLPVVYGIDIAEPREEGSA